MKKAISILILVLLFCSCKTQSVVITSKEEAIRKHQYQKTEKNKLSPLKSDALSKNLSQKEPISNKIESKQGFPKILIPEPNDLDYTENPSYNSYLSEQLVNNALARLGSQYKSGGTTIEGFDCSGLMFSTFNLFDITLPRSSNDQARIGIKIKVQDAKRGDLIFFRTNGKKIINHVGMIVSISDEEIKFVHSATHSGVIISSTLEPYYKKNFVQINRVVD